MKKASANKRIQWFHTTVQANGFPNVPLLCERFSISESQAKRDIRFLKEHLGAPLQYDALHRGYRYTEGFSLPIAITESNDETFSGLLAGTGEQDYISGELTSDQADVTFLQLQIPYTAVLEISDKLAVAELKSYIRHAKDASGKLRKNFYKCEFHSVERFLGILLSVDADIRIISPKWLRERLVNAAERILKTNTFEEDPEDDDDFEG